MPHSSEKTCPYLETFLVCVCVCMGLKGMCVVCVDRCVCVYVCVVYIICVGVYVLCVCVWCVCAYVCCVSMCICCECACECVYVLRVYVYMVTPWRNSCCHRDVPKHSTTHQVDPTQTSHLHTPQAHKQVQAELHS